MKKVKDFVKRVIGRFKKDKQPPGQEKKDAPSPLKELKVWQISK
jgi:hypothetical protein